MTAQGNPNEVLDQATLQQLLDLDDGATTLISEMFGLFLEDTPPRIDLLEQAIRCNDREQIADLAHAIKGAASTMGVLRVKACAQQLESAARHGIVAEPEAVTLVRLKEAFEESRQSLASYLESRK